MIDAIIITLAVLFVIVTVGYNVWKKKTGKSSGCGCGCSGNCSSCPSAKIPEKKEEE